MGKSDFYYMWVGHKNGVYIFKCDLYAFVIYSQFLIFFLIFNYVDEMVKLLTSHINF